MPHFRARAARHREPEDAEDEGERGQQNWAEADASGAVVVLTLPREFDAFWEPAALFAPVQVKEKD